VKTKTSYWRSIGSAVGTLAQGLGITFSHILKAGKTRKQTAIADSDYFLHQEGIATIQFPHVTIPVPDTGRYKLHNEIDDCIVCDKCAKICPVSCIIIEPIRSPEEFGKTSDGSPKRIYAAQFEIDMGKCCFCGLCTTVCPTECLTMTKEYDFSTFDIRTHYFAFGEMSPAEIDQKKKAWAIFQQSKSAAQPPAQKTEMIKPNIKPDQGAPS